MPGIFDGVGRVLMVHAHPDDETLLTGALVLELRAAGMAVDVVTCTRGEAGEVVPGSVPGGVDEGGLTAIREQELEVAGQALGVSGHVFLGTPPASADGIVRVYRDSGMAWDGDVAVASPDAPADAFSVVPMAGELADLLAFVDASRPDLLLSYDAAGTYGHPDHVRAHDLTLAAARETGLPFVAALPPDQAEPGDIVVELDEAHLPALLAAHDAHRTQFRVDGDVVTHVGGQQVTLGTSVALRCDGLAPCNSEYFDIAVRTGGRESAAPSQRGLARHPPSGQN